MMFRPLTRSPILAPDATLALVPRPRAARVIARLLGGPFLATVLALALLPWQQSVTGTGRVIDRPTGRRFPGFVPSADDGGRSCIPLRDSPGFSPGSLSLRQLALTGLRRRERSSGLLMTVPGEPAASISIRPTLPAQSRRVGEGRYARDM